ncbi:AzlC family ABC transporter permease [Azospirillum halopraeferens]|uniref:AzlC family ABC transporter permease n=1 Tax=Azospirillum halopraeferens TaxID=34010 RepID=UPI0004030D3A|nr:AzlC family ABC transporter permease [Azospirillum halopraeferens]
MPSRPLRTRRPPSPALAAVRDALGIPGVVLFASYVGFGSLVRESGLGLPEGLVSTATGWALPGQVALVELYAVGASIVTIALAVALTNTRLLPMVVTIMPLLRDDRAPRWWFYALAHVVAVTSWANGMRRLPALAPGDRLRWFAAYGAVLWSATMAGTAAGFFLAGLVPKPVTLGLVFLNPVYFLLLFAEDLRDRAKVLALGLGAVTGPVLHLAAPAYGLLATGLAAGTLAFLLDRILARRTRHRG